MTFYDDGTNLVIDFGHFLGRAGAGHHKKTDSSLEDTVLNSMVILTIRDTAASGGSLSGVHQGIELYKTKLFNILSDDQIRLQFRDDDQSR